MFGVGEVTLAGSQPQRPRAEGGNGRRGQRLMDRGQRGYGRSCRRSFHVTFARCLRPANPRECRTMLKRGQAGGIRLDRRQAGDSCHGRAEKALRCLYLNAMFLFFFFPSSFFFSFSSAGAAGRRQKRECRSQVNVQVGRIEGITWVRTNRRIVTGFSINRRAWQRQVGRRQYHVNAEMAI